jgi:predicted enzyme related to lactoylglutathione lyase
MKTKIEHIELSTDDPNLARDFYSQLFGWKIEAMPNPDASGEYLMFRTENGGGGITGKMMPEQPTAWMPYVTVASVQATLDAATRLGGGTILPFTPIGEMGAIAVVRDPTGAAIGVWETAQKPAPAAKAKKPAAKAKPAKKPAAKAKKPAPAKKKKGKR